MTYDFLLDNGLKHGSAWEGTVMFYEYDGKFYTVLPDNTVEQVESMKDWDEYEE